MNREQMIAWLTIEGWEYRPADAHWYPSCLGNGKRAIDDDGHVYWANPQATDAHPFPPSAPWNTCPAATVRQFYDLILKGKPND
jgi:hypothetical protein